jgi:hypothetical protein
MAKKTLTASELVLSHKPKNYKYRFIIKDDTLLKELEQDQFDFNVLDTIDDPDLVKEALQAEYKLYERTIIGKAKEPTDMGNGIMLSKKMVTKADKKLLQLGMGFFEYRSLTYMVVRLFYERFDIIEIFVLT